MNIRHIFIFCSVIIVSFMLTSCSFLSPVKATPANTYWMSESPDYVYSKHRRPITILVLAPETSPAFNTTDIAFSKCLYQIAYYGQNKWAETPSQMLQPLIVETLDKSHAFKAVVSSPYTGRYQYYLKTEILELLQDFTHKQATVIFKVRAQIVRMSTASVVATRTFRVVVPLQCPPPYGGIMATNKAFVIFLSELDEFVVRRAR